MHFLDEESGKARIESQFFDPMTLALSVRLRFCLNAREVKGAQLSMAVKW